LLCFGGVFLITYRGKAGGTSEQLPAAGGGAGPSACSRLSRLLDTPITCRRRAEEGDAYVLREREPVKGERPVGMEVVAGVQRFYIIQRCAKVKGVADMDGPLLDGFVSAPPDWAPATPANGGGHMSSTNAQPTPPRR
jgi:hypothetical protein